MAIIKLGSIVTSIAGSIGGSTFRRTPRGIIAYNKQGRQSRSALASASQRLSIGSLFAQWRFLDKATQNQYISLAALYSFPDRFGNQIFLSGRQFFTKLNSQLLPVNQVVDLANFDDEIPKSIVTDIALSVEDEYLNVAVAGVVSSSYICIAFYNIRKGGSIKPHAHFKPTTTRLVNENTVLDVWDAFKAQFPFAQIGSDFGCNIYFINPSGFKSPTQSFVVTAI